jgi:leucyl aminopeptidase (aminopeptidase T)
VTSLPSIAKSIVGSSLRPKEDEVVLISTFPHSIELAENIALECQKAGADPAIWLDTDGLFYAQFKNYSKESLRRVSAHCLGLLDYVNSYVWISGPRDPAPMAKVQDETFAAFFEGEKAHGDKALEKKPKNVEVALGQVTRERAKAYGFNYAKWKAMVEAAITVNYGRMESLGRLVAGLLSNPVPVRLKADNGTDLRVRLAGSTRAAHVFDGVISDADLAVGTAASRSVFLPAGEVAIAPVEESAEGTFVADLPVPQRGRLVEGISWTFHNGHVTDFAAKRNLRFAQTNWSEASGQKDVFGGLAFGLNPKAQPGFLQNFIVSGAVSVRIGDNRDLGGTNDSSYGFGANLAHATVEIGGKKVIENGSWII